MQQACQNPLKPALSWNPARIWVPLFMMAGISVLSGSAGVQTGGWSFAGIDKLAHFFVFGLLGISWARVFPPARHRPPQRLLYAAGLAALFGLLDELHQFHNPLRTFEWGDLAADLAGALAWAAAYLHIRPLQALLELEFRYPARLLSLWRTPNSGKSCPN